MIHAIIHTPSARAKGAARQWVQNRDVWVLLVDGPEPVATLHDRRIQRREYFGRADARYSGARSYYGQCLAAAYERRDALEREWSTE